MKRAESEDRTAMAHAAQLSLVQERVDFDYIERAITAACDEARAEEREAIAQMVETCVGSPCQLEGIRIVVIDELATAIRARANKEGRRGA